MKMRIHVLVLSALAFTGVSGCQPSGKEAGNDSTVSETSTPAASAIEPVQPIAEPAIAQGKAAAAAPAAKTPGEKLSKAELLKQRTDSINKAGKANAARADSIKQAQGKAEAARIARLDSLKKAEAAKAAAKPEPVVARVEAASAGGTGQSAEGKAPYEENCRKCHGVLGVPPKTMKRMFPKIVTFDAAFFAKRSDDSVVTVLTKGKNEDMKSFKDKLTHAQMVAVAAYIRSLSR